MSLYQNQKSLQCGQEGSTHTVLYFITFHTFLVFYLGGGGGKVGRMERFPRNSPTSHDISIAADIAIDISEKVYRKSCSKQIIVYIYK